MAMRKNPQFCFTHSSGEDIYLFTLNNRKGTEIIISNYGAVITSLKLQVPGRAINDVVLGFDRMEDYLGDEYLAHYPWFGAAIGRYANRIKDARFHMHQKIYSLSRNNHHDQLHGGKEGFDKKVWKPVQFTDSVLELAYTSADGEEGFPGNLSVRIQFEMNEAGECSYTYRAGTDRSTPVNLSHHGYFNLNNGRGTIEDHEIRILASHILQQDDNLVATGNLLPTRDTRYDFTQWKRIGAEGVDYDQSFVTEHAGGKLERVAEARSAHSGLRMELWTTEPVLHFYTGKWIPRVRGKHAVEYGPHSGFCFETQVHPNAVNIPHFPNTILEPGQEYYQKTVYKFFPLDSK